VARFVNVCRGTDDENLPIVTSFDHLLRGRPENKTDDVRFGFEHCLHLGFVILREIPWPNGTIDAELVPIGIEQRAGALEILGT
jgi:hypothetical protein